MSRKVLLFAVLAVASAAAELPVRQVILYKHGVGYFERAGELRGGESARLDFKSEEMNDVLKSLTIQDAGGKVVGLRYDSNQPLSKKLSEYPFTLGDAHSLAMFLDQVKGARIEMRMGQDTVAGAVVSAQLIPGSERQSRREQVVLMLDSGELRTLDLSAASAVKLQDPALQQQLREYLGALSLARSKEKRSVYIDSSDTPSRRVSATYMIPTPVWKSSYRLILRDAEPTLEGWAIIDNTTGEDWDKVQLALVSGRPISFISRLYEPRYLTRQVAELPEDRAQAPVMHEGAVGLAGKAAGVLPGGVVGGLQGRWQTAAAPPQPPPPAAAALESAHMTAAAPSSIAATAQGRELGELFEYRFGAPVTVKKNESAMLPFLQQKIAARKLLIYSDESSQHPLNAAELTNSTGKTLDGGPVTVFEAGAYAGEALMETVKAGDKRLISYGIDLGTRVTTAFDSEVAMVREIRLRRGILTTRAAKQETKTFTIRNVDARAKTLILETPARQGYKVLNQKPVETTSRANRFEVRLTPGATERFALIEESLEESSIEVTNLTPDVLVSYTQNKAISEAGRRTLEQIAALKRDIAGLDRDMNLANRTINELGQDQQRLRDNLNSLNRVSGQQDQVQRYARQLADQEIQIATQRDQVSALRKKKAALETELTALIAKAEF